MHIPQQLTYSLLVIVTLQFVSACYYSESFIKNLYESLYSNGNTIKKIFHEPESAKGPILISALENYNENLAQLVSIIREDNSTFAPARKFCDDGGPEFLKIKHDNDNLKNTFNWTEDSLEEMYYLKGATELLWWELQQLDPTGATYPIIHNNTNDEINFLYEMDKDNRLNELLEFTKINDFERTDKPHKQLQS